jgi:hypothetical protein
MLLFIIFIGLLCLRLHERSAFRVGLGRPLWGQVGYGRFSLAVVFSIH